MAPERCPHVSLRRSARGKGSGSDGLAHAFLNESALVPSSGYADGAALVPIRSSRENVTGGKSAPALADERNRLISLTTSGFSRRDSLYRCTRERRHSPGRHRNPSLRNRRRRASTPPNL